MRNYSTDQTGVVLHTTYFGIDDKQEIEIFVMLEMSCLDEDVFGGIAENGVKRQARIHQYRSGHMKSFMRPCVYPLYSKLSKQRLLKLLICYRFLYFGGTSLFNKKLNQVINPCFSFFFPLFSAFLPA